MTVMCTSSHPKFVPVELVFTSNGVIAKFQGREIKTKNKAEIIKEIIKFNGVITKIGEENEV